MLRQSLRMVGLLMAGLLAVALMSGPASAGEYPTDSGISVDDPTVEPGDTVRITGESCIVGAEVTIFLGGVEVGTAIVGADGTFSATFEVPAGTAAGTYEVTVADCGAEVLGTTITVGGPTPTTIAGTNLPRTGSSSTEPLVRTGAVLVVAGAVLVYAVRRRQQATFGS